MSLCMSPHVGRDGIEDREQKQFVARFLKGLAPDGHYAGTDWNLMSLADMCNAGNSLADIMQLVPFRGGQCPRTRRCCGDCVRQCYTRCVQDCLHRLWVWNQMVQATPEAERDRIPLAVRLIVNQKFESHQQLSWCVGEILSRKTNAQLKEYMERAGLNNYTHPYRNEYGPTVRIDPKTGRRMVNPITGQIQLVEWPESGLCPYCLPNVTIDRHYVKKEVK